MTSESNVERSIAEQAAQWWVEFHDGDPSTGEHREFREWVMRSPERVEAYLRVAQLNQAIKAPGLRWPDTPSEVLIRESLASAPEVTSVARGTVKAPLAGRHRARTYRIGMVASLVATLVVGIGAAWFMAWRPLQLQTKFGEQASFVLDDGSRVTLNSASKIEVRLRKDHRLVRLVSGEALFEVAHDAARPFEVRAGETTLRDVGTQFDVDLRPTRTTVTVAEGRVAVLTADGRLEHDSPTLRAADQLVITQARPLVAQHDVNVAAALSWTQHKLVFEHRALGEIAEEFNRYNRGHIEIVSKTLREQEITGAFASNDPASFLGFLAHIPGVRIRDDGADGHVVTIDETAPAGR